SQWQPQYFNLETLRWLRDDWNISVIRAPLGVHHGGYLENPDQEQRKIATVVEAAIELGLYVIVDWHSHLPEAQRAAEFFSSIAGQYHNVPNIIYELWNEPLGEHSWEETVRPYHCFVAERVRSLDSKNVIVAGTPSWSRDVDVAANLPLDCDNLA